MTAATCSTPCGSCGFYDCGIDYCTCPTPHQAANNDSNEEAA